MMRFPLGDNEQKVLDTLARSGVMSPSQVSAETWLLPGDALAALKLLNDFGLVLMRDDTDSADGKLVALTSEGRDLAEKENFRQQMKMYK
jgi:DNA-binding MarR family transcriptional regulator